MTDLNIEAVFSIDGLFVEVAWKSSVILAIASLLHLLIRRRSPIVVSFGWNSVLTALTILPFAADVTPLQVDYVADPPVAAGQRLTPTVEAVPLDAVPPSIAALGGDAVREAEVDVPVNRVTENSPAIRVSKSIEFWQVVAAVYLCGSFLCGLRLLLSIRKMVRLLVASREVSDFRWTDAVLRWKSQLGIRRSVRIRGSSKSIVPFTTGVFRPVIVLPESLIESTNPADCDVIILHEVTHIARHDSAWHYLLKLLQIAYWWQPLLWLSGRQVADVRERVCDLFCVGTLGNRERYADVLLSIVQSISRPVDLAVGLAMARVPRISRRLDEISEAPELKTYRPPRPLSAFLLLATVFATTVFAAGIVDVVAQPQQPAAAHSQLDGSSTTDTGERPADTNQPVPLDDDELLPAMSEEEAQAGIEKLIGKQFRLNRNGAVTEAVFGGHKMSPELLGHLSKLTNLRTLYLHRTEVTDRGMESLRSLIRLRKLYLGQTNIGDAGIAHLKNLAQIEYLSLGETQVTSTGLQHLNGLTSLRVLSLYKTPVTDTGLGQLRGLQNLELLTLQQTQVTDEGVRKLQEALPQLVIYGKPEWAVKNPNDAKELSVSIAVPARDSIRSIDVRNPGSHFNVVVTNRTIRDLQLWETWNSWGYYNLSFEVLDEDGNVKYSITKRPRAWTINGPTWVVVRPGEHFNIPVDFDPDIWAVSVAAGREKRTLVPLLAQFATSPKFELKLRAVFRVYPDDETIDRDIWTGTVRSVADEFLIHHSPERVSRYTRGWLSPWPATVPTKTELSRLRGLMPADWKWIDHNGTQIAIALVELPTDSAAYVDVCGYTGRNGQERAADVIWSVRFQVPAVLLRSASILQDEDTGPPVLSFTRSLSTTRVCPQKRRQVQTESGERTDLQKPPPPHRHIRRGHASPPSSERDQQPEPTEASVAVWRWVATAILLAKVYTLHRTTPRRQELIATNRTRLSRTTTRCTIDSWV